MSPMAATHHSQLNDAIFSLPLLLFPLFFSFFPPLPWRRLGRGRVRRPIRRGHVEFTRSRWEGPPPPPLGSGPERRPAAELEDNNLFSGCVCVFCFVFCFFAAADSFPVLTSV